MSQSRRYTHSPITKLNGTEIYLRYIELNPGCTALQVRHFVGSTDQSVHRMIRNLLGKKLIREKIIKLDHSPGKARTLYITESGRRYGTF